MPVVLSSMLRYVSKPFYSMQKIMFIENTDTVLYRRSKMLSETKCLWCCQAEGAVKYMPFKGIEVNIIHQLNRIFKHTQQIMCPKCLSPMKIISIISSSYL